MASAFALTPFTPGTSPRLFTRSSRDVAHPGSARQGEAGLQTFDAPLQLAVLAGCTVAISSRVRRSRAPRSYFGSMSPEEQAARTEAKRERETRQFQAYQKRLMRTGLPERDERFWGYEEAAIFQSAHVSKGIDFRNYDDIPVETTGGQGDEKPIQTFQEIGKKFSIPKGLADNFDRCGYSTPTPVQKYSIPAALAGTDVMVSAQTGSGKTAAFLVPVVSAALKKGKQELSDEPVAPTSIVLAPTRELCQQITMEVRRFCFRTDIRIASIYGGAPAMPQLNELAEGCEIAICTPGRLNDFLGRGVMSVEKVKHLTIDEADRMLDMGFEPQIRQIVEEYGMPEPGLGDDGRHTMMFSATFPEQIQNMALDYLDPSYMWISVGEVSSATSLVEQRFEDLMHGGDKFEALLSTLRGVKDEDGSVARSIVFANQKSTVDELAYRLSGMNIRASPIHGGLTQAQRDQAIASLKKGFSRVLIATDVASRGLDIPGVEHVINYDLPMNAEDYVHRIGRTGRIGNRGIATSLVGSDERALRDIVRSMQVARQSDAAVGEVPEWLEQQAY